MHKYQTLRFPSAIEWVPSFAFQLMSGKVHCNCQPTGIKLSEKTLQISLVQGFSVPLNPSISRLKSIFDKSEATIPLKKLKSSDIFLNLHTARDALPPTGSSSILIQGRVFNQRYFKFEPS